MADQPFTNLDFENVKTNLKNFLKGQDQFKDYDFEGSNINVLLDVLAYNTFQNNFYTNMAISEMFLDSAQIKDSVVSHAKELNYLPRSRRSSRALMRVEFFPNDNPATITIPERTRFTARCGASTYSFWNDRSYIIRPDENNNYIINDLEVFEGRYLEEFYPIEGTSEQRIVLSNDNIDTRSIRVFVRENQSSTSEVEYTFRQNLFDVASTDNVFYLQPYSGNRYEIIFGQNSFGRQPVNGNVIRVQYRMTAGEEANGIDTISLENPIDGYSSNESVLGRSSGGAERESIESIRYFAPKSIQIQERAVTENDYAILLRNAFPEIRSLSVYGGERLNPPRYGKVVIAAFVNDDETISQPDRERYIEFLNERSPMTIEPLIIPAKFMYVDVLSKVFYNVNRTSKTSGLIETIARNSIATFSTNNLEEFKKNLRFSKLSSHIDSSDPSIVSNDTTLRAIIEIKPERGEENFYTLEFDNELRPDVTYTELQINSYEPCIVSTSFVFNNRNVFIQDNGNGVLNILQNVSGDISFVKRNVGTVNYETGAVTINNIVIQDYETDAIKFYARLKSKDIIAPKDRILITRLEDIEVDVVGIRQ